MANSRPEGNLNSLVVKKEDQQKKDSSDQEGKKKLLKDLEKKEQAQLDELFEEASTKPDKPVKQAAQSSGKSAPVVDAAFTNSLARFRMCPLALIPRVLPSLARRICSANSATTCSLSSAGYSSCTGGDPET